MALLDDLKAYVAKHGKPAPDLGDAEVVIVGEHHDSLIETQPTVLSVSVNRLLRELLADQRYRYFGNESFQNAGPVRKTIRAYWERAQLPPDFIAGDPAHDALNPQQIGSRVMPRRFKPVLDDLRAKPRYILAIGSRSREAHERDRRLALHFFEEIKDRKIPRHTPGVLLLGAFHAAAVPQEMGQTSTRMIIEKQGYRCVSIRLFTDFSWSGGSTDGVMPLASGTPAAIKLGPLLPSLLPNTRTCFSTRHGGPASSPFYRVREPSSDSGHSLAEQFEHIVLHKT